MTKIYEVPACNGPIIASVKVPGSKSITNRALLAAALSANTVELTNVLFSDDSRHFMDCLMKLGFEVAVDEPARVVRVTGQGGLVPESNAAINVGSAGTAARFITAMLAASEGEYLIEAAPQMAGRPMKPLLDALRIMGAEFTFLKNHDCLPFRMKGHGLKGGRVTLDSSASSQFLSALLLVGGMARKDLEIHIHGDLPAKPFVEMTIRMMADFGVMAENFGFKNLVVPVGQSYIGRNYQIEPDVSNTCYFLAMAVLTGGTVTAEGVFEDSLQGDLEFIEILKQMGAATEWTEAGLKLTGPRGGKFAGVDVDLSAMPDQTPTLAALAPFATSPTRIRGVGFIRHHESNRLEAIVNELTRMGIQAEETDDGLLIHPGKPQPVEIETYEDHRMAMAFALVGLKVPGMKIKNPGCTGKTFEDYFEYLERVITV